LRYAILFSGMSFQRHVNGLEFCYRTLVERVGFAAENVQVLNYDGSLRAYADPQEPPRTVWPGDGTPFRMRVNAEGSREAFRSALRALGRKLTTNDQVFISTAGHGAHHDDGRGPDLLTYPDCSRYKRDELCADLATLPPHQSLIVLMAQCFSGGFNQSIVEASPAAQTFIAAATQEKRQSCMTLDDGHWDSFHRNWLAALGGRDVDGATIALDAGYGSKSRATVHEAFAYATRPDVANPYDSPQFLARPDTAARSRLTD
jgi:Peptidase C13 family